MSRYITIVALSLCATVLPLGAQQTRTNSQWFGPVQIAKEGMTFSVRALATVEWTPSAREGLFGENNIHVRVNTIQASHGSEILHNGKVYDQYSFGGELTEYFRNVRVNWIAFGTTLNGVRNCIRFSDAVWNEGETVTRFCGASNSVTFGEWRISDAGVSGIRELREAIRRLERAEAEKERERLEEQRRDSVARVSRARQDSLRRAQLASADSARRAEYDRQDSVRRAGLSEAERRRERDQFVRDSTRRAREESPEARQRRAELAKVQADAIAARARYLAQVCQRADVAYRSGNLIQAIQLYDEIQQAGPNAAYCYGVAQRRISDARTTYMANSAASLIAVVGQAFDVEAGLAFTSFPVPRDDFSGIGAGITVGKGIYYVDALIGNGVFGPMFRALNPVEPDFSFVGCSGPFGTDNFGNPCADYYDQLADVEESRYRVNAALTLGIVYPKGLGGQIYPTANLSYVSTDDGNLLVPAIGIVWTDHRTVKHPRYGELYGGGGFRFAATFHQGNVGFQFGVSTSW